MSEMFARCAARHCCLSKLMLLVPVLLGALVLLPAGGCGGKPATPPPGAEQESPKLDVDLGSDSNTSQDASDESKSSPAGGGAPAGEQGEK